jgi:hypothetical protein
MPKTTQAEIERRMAIVQDRIGERGWSLQIALDLAAEMGVSRETVYAYRRRVIERTRIELSEQELDEMRSEFLERIRGHQRAALDAGKLGPLAAMMTLESKITGVERAAEVDVQPVSVTLHVPGPLSE